MAVDLLSDVLTTVRLIGALIFRVDLRGPWGVAGDPTLQKFAPLLPPGTNQIVAFHIVLNGKCWMRHERHDWFQVPAGRAVIVPRGDPHQLCDRPGRTLVPFADMLEGRPLPEIRHVRFDAGSGPSVSLLCGFLGCDRHAFESLFHALPPIFDVALGGGPEALARYAAAQALDEYPGAQSLRVRMAEVLFMEALREYMRSIPADATGWLAGLRDPLVARALSALHAAPGRNWSVQELATQIASSRSSLATRFRTVVGEPPMHYLTRWRMQLAARALGERSCSIDGIASEVGYESSAAFQRAFKRRFAMTPAAWRQQAQGSRQATSSR